MTFSLTEVNLLKTLEHDAIDLAITRRRDFYEDYRRRWSYLSSAIVPYSYRINADVIAQLHELADTLASTQVEYRMITSSDRAWIYANDVGLLEEITTSHKFDEIKYTEAVVNRAKNTVRLKNSRYTHRTYFKCVKLDSADVENLVNFFQNQKGNIRFSPALDFWLTLPNSRLWDNFFIDHDGEQYTLMLALVCPSIIRKTMLIVTD